MNQVTLSFKILFIVIYSIAEPSLHRSKIILEINPTNILQVFECDVIYKSNKTVLRIDKHETK